MSGGAPVRLMSALAVRAALERTVLPLLAAEGGPPVAVEWAPTAILMEAVAGGRRADAILVMAGSMDRLLADGVADPASRVDLCDSLVGLGVREGARHPDIATAEALRQTLLAADSIVCSAAGASGAHFRGVLERLGIARAVAGRLITIPSGLTGEMVAAGQAELAVQQVSELMQVPGIAVVGPLPGDLAGVSTLSAARFREAALPTAADRLLAALAGAAAADAYRASGLRPRTAGAAP